MATDFKAIFGATEGLDPKSVEFLARALERNNLPGFDYLEFKQSLNAMSKMNMNMDETTSVKSAFATASTMGLTKEKLLESAMHYKKILANEKTQFDVAMQNQVQKNIAGKKEEVTKLQDRIKQYENRIKELQEQIVKSQATIDGADAQIQAAKNKIQGTKQNFETAHQSIISLIENDIQKFNSFL